MGLIERLRSWLSGLGGHDPDEPTEKAETDEDDGPDDPEPSLDPAAAAETRSATTDDAVDALREVRRATSTEAENGQDDTETAGDDTN